MFQVVSFQVFTYSSISLSGEFNAEFDSRAVAPERATTDVIECNKTTYLPA